LEEQNKQTVDNKRVVVRRRQADEKAFRINKVEKMHLAVGQ
jgi:hypothetical protein